uniref:Rad60/SUMO-like domain-containing protein n=1 Tax=Equus caballus TaxID=9796 RepID=F6V5I0_HORSE
MADEKPKEGVKTENNDHINLKVAGQDGSVVQFKIKRHTPLSKLMKCQYLFKLVFSCSLDKYPEME